MPRLVQEKPVKHPKNGKDLFLVCLGEVPPSLDEKGDPKPKSEKAPLSFYAILLQSAAVNELWDGKKPITWESKPIEYPAFETRVQFKSFNKSIKYQVGGIYRANAVTYGRHTAKDSVKEIFSLNIPTLDKLKNATLEQYLAKAALTSYFLKPADVFTKKRNYSEEGVYALSVSSLIAQDDAPSKIDWHTDWFPKQPNGSSWSTIDRENLTLDTSCFKYVDRKSEATPTLGFPSEGQDKKDLQIYLQQKDDDGNRQQYIVFARLWECLDLLQLDPDDWYLLGPKLFKYLCGTLMLTVSRKKTANLVLQDKDLAECDGICVASAFLNFDVARIMKEVGLPVSAEHAKQFMDKFKRPLPERKVLDTCWMNAVNLNTCDDEIAANALACPSLKFYALANFGQELDYDERQQIEAMSSDAIYKGILEGKIGAIKLKYPNSSKEYVNGFPTSTAIYAVVDSSKFEAGKAPTLHSLIKKKDDDDDEEEEGKQETTTTTTAAAAAAPEAKKVKEEPKAAVPNATPKIKKLTQSKKEG